MCGRAISLLLILLSTTLPTLGDCTWSPRYSGQFRTTAYDVAVDSDGYVWLATGYGVQLLAPLAGGRYTQVGAVAVPGTTRVLELNGSLAYVGSGSRVYLVQRNGERLTLGNSVDTGGTVNDLLIHGTYLFAATSNGIAHIELFELRRTSVSLFTSRATVTSLAVNGNTMYAADGDASVETFTLSIPSLPQGTAPLDSLARSSSVHVSNGILYVSDELGQSTDVFVGTARTGRISYGSNAFAPLAGGSFFAAGPQRTFRALDATSLTRVAQLFAQQLLPLGGTNNRIYAMARGGNTLFIAAGDMGLVTYDVSSLASPHALVSYADGAKNSALVIGDKAYFADSTTIAESSINRAGISLTPGRTWNAATTMMHDATATSLVTSNGAELRVVSTEGTTTFNVTMAANVRAAVLSGSTIVTNLTDDSVWRVPLGGTPQATTEKARFLARSGTGVILGTVTDDGRTPLRYYANGDLTTPPRVFTLDGAAIGGVALNGTSAAVFTFKGLNVIDLAGGAVRVIPGSDRTLPKQLLFSGTDLLVLGDLVLAVWDTTRDSLVREHPLPVTPLQMSAANGVAVIASSGGSTAIAYNAALPKGTAATGNRFYTKSVAAQNDLYLFEDGRIDVFWTGSGAAPAYVTAVSSPGAIDIAAFPGTLYALGAAGSVTAYSNAGAQLAQVTINEGPGSRPLSILTVASSVWVSFEKGCTFGNCQRTTYVLDPKTLAVTNTMGGGATRAVEGGVRIFGLFTLPEEIRGLRANPALGLPDIAIASPANATDIAYANGRVYVMANKVFAYNDSLQPAGEFLDASNAAASLTVAGDCAVIIGRGEHPLQYTLPSFAPAASQILVPSPAKGLAQQLNRLFVLTEHSIEVWANAPLPAKGKRRAAQ
ncbi:MAG TPA: hypothetical protein VKB93_14540 [Thermoanaerobaculia bacterium]|nr:hypothetical protein [Thermoanaerobaculia bacterium]